MNEDKTVKQLHKYFFDDLYNCFVCRSFKNSISMVIWCRHIKFVFTNIFYINKLNIVQQIISQDQIICIAYSCNMKMFASMGLKYLTFTHIRSFLTSSFFLLSIVHMPTFPQESIYADGSITVAVPYLVNETLQKSVCLSLISPDFFIADHLLCLLFCNKKSLCLGMLLY